MAKDVQGTVGETVEGVKDAVLARLSNPLLGSFALTWLLVNHRIVMVVLSGMSIEEKFKFLDAALLADSGKYYANTVLIPLGAALLFTFLWPIVGMGVERFNLWVERKSVARRLASKAIEVLPMTEALAMRSSLETHVAQGKNIRHDMARLKIELATFRAIVAAFRKKEEEQCLTNHLLSQEFGVYTTLAPMAEQVAKLVFSEDGSMVAIPQNARNPLPDELMFWEVEGTKLRMFSVDRKAKRELMFQESSGRFVGQYFGDRNCIKGLTFSPFK